MKKLNLIRWISIILLALALFAGLIIYALIEEPLGNGSLNGYPM